MSDYTKQLAWYSITPEKRTKSRLEDLRDKGGEPDMPELYEIEYLAKVLERCGVCKSGFNGVEPLNSVDVMEWQRGTKYPLSGWEFQAIIDASRAYCAQYHQSKDPLTPAPYRSKIDFNRSVISDKLTSAFRSRIKSDKEKATK